MHCNPLLGSLILPPFPSWPTFPMPLSCLPASGLRLILPFIIRGDEWHSRISSPWSCVWKAQALTVASSPPRHRLLPVCHHQLQVLCSWDQTFASHPPLQVCYEGPPPWQREPTLGSRNKSLLVCLIRAEDKDNTDSNKKHLVSVWSDRAQTFSPVWLFVISWTEKPAVDWSMSGFSVHGILLQEY